VRIRLRENCETPVALRGLINETHTLMNAKRISLFGIAAAMSASVALAQPPHGVGRSGGSPHMAIGRPGGITSTSGMATGRPGFTPRTGPSATGNRNWSGSGNWSGHHHHHRGSVVFIGGFGYPYWYDYYYPYGYYDPYAYYGYGQPAAYDDRGGYDDSLVVDVQQRLARGGYYNGAIDGVMGPATRRAIRAYERAHGLRPDGLLDERLLSRMGLR
jgi:putative peptidoglycan binding protein